jgi:hypothetical protein
MHGFAGTNVDGSSDEEEVQHRLASVVRSRRLDYISQVDTTIQ